MKVISGLKKIKGLASAGSIVTVGVFDGVHVGHAHLLKNMVRRAKALGAKSVVLTFDPHPLKVLNKSSEAPSLISLKHRVRLIEREGVDYLVMLRFTRSASRIPPEEFIKKILVDGLSLKEIYVGENFYFGKGAKAGVDTLRNFGMIFDFKVRVIKPVKVDRKVVSSSSIRSLILKGKIGKARKFLGRPVTILGTVVSGFSRGRELGFPTANVNPHHEVIPPAGVYAVKVNYRGRLLNGVLNIGVRPTFFRGGKDIEPTTEVHIFDFDKKIYGEDIELVFVKKIRDEMKFKTKDDLASEIRRDVSAARAILR